MDVTLRRLASCLALVGLAACSALPDERGQGPEPVDDGTDDPIDFDDVGDKDELFACASASVDAKAVPVDMMILLDRSYSMVGENWAQSTLALKTFLTDPASTGINVGISFFPVEYAPDKDTCNQAHYRDLRVPLGALPGNASAMIASINATEPDGGGTPMFGALKGVLLNAVDRKGEFSDHKVIVVFASDGDPNGCFGPENDVGLIAQLVESARTYNGVETYAIAINGALVSNLNQIAIAGGTQHAYDVTADPALFSEKIKEIRAKAVGCEFRLPDAPDGKDLDTTRVNVRFKTGDEAVEGDLLPQAKDLASCAATGGWFYDDPADPSSISLCPTSCNVAAMDGAAVEIVLGCETRIE